MPRKPTALFWSGGKDSALALHALHTSQDHEVVSLITTGDVDGNSTMHQMPRFWLEAQAEQLDLPLHWIPIVSGADYNQTITEHLSTYLSQYDIRALAFGDLYLEDIRGFRVSLCESLQVEPVFPVWGLPTDRLADSCAKAGIQAWVTCVQTPPLQSSDVGQRYDSTWCGQLPASVDPAGEQGEFHTFVTNGALFRAPVQARPAATYERHWTFRTEDGHETTQTYVFTSLERIPK